MKNKTMFDMLAFLAPQMRPPIPSEELLGMDLCLSVTACPPRQFFQGFDGESLSMEMLNSIERYVTLLEENGVTIIRSLSDYETPGLKVVLNIQDPLPNASIHMHDLYTLGVRIMQLSYQGPNEYGGGFLSDASLTSEGKSAIKSMSVNRMILDLSHANTATALDALREAKGNGVHVMISHTASFQVYDNPRNAHDEVISAVMGAGGIVGLFGLTFCLDQNDDTAKSFLKHLNHIRTLHENADNCIVYGSDGWYCDYEEGNTKNTFEMLKQKLDPHGLLRARFPDQIIEFMGVERISKTCSVLQDLGVVKSFLYKMFHVNPERFLFRALSQ
jgi:microsomal dipeptidase-like Zn-dependent dipeptidase